MSAAYDTCLAVAAAHARLQRKLDDELGTFHGLGFADFRLLTSLAGAPGERMTTAALSRPLGVQPSAVVRQVLALEKSGWVERIVDGPQRWVALRPLGRRLQREAAETAASICTDALAPIDGDAERAACDVLQALQASPALELRR